MTNGTPPTLSVQCENNGPREERINAHDPTVRRGPGLVSSSSGVGGHGAVRLDPAYLQSRAPLAEEEAMKWELFCGVWWCLATEIVMQRVELAMQRVERVEAES